MRYLNIENNRLSFNKIAKQYAEVLASVDEAPFIDDFLLATSGRRILDAGCGVGQYCNYMRERGFAVIGYDYSEKMLEMARLQYPDITFKHQDLMTLNDKNKFDGILLNEVLGYFTKNQCTQVFENLHKALKEDGIMLVSVQEGLNEGFHRDPFGIGCRMYVKQYLLPEFEELYSSLFETVGVKSLKVIIDPATSLNRLFVMLKKKKPLENCQN